MIIKKINEELCGIELYFEEKPAEETREALKAAGYRWHRVKKCWYAKQTAGALKLADDLNAETESTETEKATAKRETAEAINTDDLKSLPCLYGSELAAAIRADLKARGVKGVTVRGRRGTGITVTVKAGADEIASVEEMKKRYTLSAFCCDVERYGAYTGERWIYDVSALSAEEKEAEYNKTIINKLVHVSDFSEYHHERRDYPELTTAFYNKLLAIFNISNQWNYDNSDYMTDYHDKGYYLDINIKKPDGFTPRENMTDEERAVYDEEIRREEEERRAALAKYEEEQKESRRLQAEYEKKKAADMEIINNNISVVDLNEKEHIYVTDLAGGCGKEATLEELEESINGYYMERGEAVITRKVIFKTEAAYKTFTNYFLCDFEFLDGKGGTGSEDIRLQNINRIYDLNEDQRRTVKFYLCDCIGIYLGDELRLVVDPEGYSYARYVFKPTAETKAILAETELERQRAASENKKPFYFPADVIQQAENIKLGQLVTVYQSDGWNLCSVYGGAGLVEDVSAGSYAQYNGVFITLKNGKKSQRVFIRNGKKTLIYNGIKPALPDELTKRKINDTMSELLQSDEIFEGLLSYYQEAPLVDTIQR